MSRTRSSRSRITDRLFIGAFGSLVFLLAPSSAGAQSLYGCYVPKSGTVYLIKQQGLPSECHSKQHVEFTWNGTGPQGPEGPEGPQGPAGPTGPQGPSGPLSGLEFRSASVTIEPSTPTANFGIFFATCSTPTKSVMNFGYDPGQGSPAPFSSRPALNGNVVLWGFRAPAGASYAFYWTCVDGVLATP